MTTAITLDVLFFTRGRGRGHAIPDAAIVRSLRALNHEVEVAFVSYATGAAELAAAGEEVIDLGLPDMTSPLDVLVPAGRALQSKRARLIVSHEEPGALYAAKMFQLKTVYISHWLSRGNDIYSNSLTYADEILIIENEHIAPAPAHVRNRTRYVGPVLRAFRFTRADREAVRADLHLASGEVVVLVAPGSWSEKLCASLDLIIGAFDRLPQSNKKLIWLTGTADCEAISARLTGRPNVTVVSYTREPERLIVAADVAITKGTYNISKELAALGVPSISLSLGQSPLDELFLRAIPTNRFLWAAETDAETLAGELTRAIDGGLADPDLSALDGTGACIVASAIDRHLTASRSGESYNGHPDLVDQPQWATYLPSRVAITVGR